ncbi:MAG: hypothetical protein GY830_00825 [Bacteroidetes bacterium]|nr:hypothetical protein [Bacteroidota bacterium]
MTNTNEALVVGATASFNNITNTERVTDMIVIKIDQNRDLVFGVVIGEDKLYEGGLSIIEKNNQIFVTGLSFNQTTDLLLYPLVILSSENGTLIKALNIGLGNSGGLEIIETKDIL